MKRTLEKITCFIVLCMYVVSFIGATGYLFYIHQPFIAVCNVFTCCLAFPVAAEIFNFLKD